MPKVSDACKQAMDESKGDAFELLLALIAMREFLRAVSKNYTVLDESWASVGGTSTAPPEYVVAAAEKAKDMEFFFHAFIGSWIEENGIVGWNNETCSMNWSEYACFCNGAAKAYLLGQDGEPILRYLESYKIKPEVMVAATPCDPSVLSDGFYGNLPTSASKSTEPLPEPDPNKTDPNVQPVNVIEKDKPKYPWMLVAGGAALLIGIVVLASSKKGR